MEDNRVTHAVDLNKMAELKKIEVQLIRTTNNETPYMLKVNVIYSLDVQALLFEVARRALLSEPVVILERKEKSERKEP